MSGVNDLLLKKCNRIPAILYYFVTFFRNIRNFPNLGWASNCITLHRISCGFHYIGKSHTGYATYFYFFLFSFYLSQRFCSRLKLVISWGSLGFYFVTFSASFKCHLNVAHSHDRPLLCWRWDGLFGQHYIVLCNWHLKTSASSPERVHHSETLINWDQIRSFFKPKQNSSQNS